MNAVDGSLAQAGPAVPRFIMEGIMANQLSPRDRFSPLSRFDPFSDMDELMRDFFAPALRLRETAAPHIRVDISETEQAYQVQADIPGVHKDDIKVSIDGNRVSISADIKDARVTRDHGGKTVRSEREYGQQYRSFVLPHEVDEAGAQARYQDGVLHLDLPKKEGTGGRQLAIQ